MMRLHEDTRKFLHGILSNEKPDIAKYPNYLRMVARLTPLASEATE
jgi:hypothetical protein